MSGPEISYFFHEAVILLTYLTGIILTIFISKKFRIQYPVVFIVLLICSVLFFIFSGLVESFIKPEMYIAFPHIDHTLGFLGIILGIYISKLLFRLPEKPLYMFTLILLALYTFTQFGCLAGYCIEVHRFNKISFDVLNPEHYKDLQAVIIAGLFEFRKDPTAYVRITGGIISLILILGVYPRLRDTNSIIILSLLFVILISFLSQFFLPYQTTLSLIQTHAGLNVFQWIFLMAGLFLILSLFISESRPKRKQPVLQIRIPSDYGLFGIYFTLSILSLQYPYRLELTDLIIFSSGFFLSTIYLLFYFYTRIQKKVLRFFTVGIILILGILFMHNGFFENMNMPGKENEIPVVNYSKMDLPVKSTVDKKKMILHKNQPDTLINDINGSLTHTIPLIHFNDNEIDYLFRNYSHTSGRKPKLSPSR